MSTLGPALRLLRPRPSTLAVVRRRLYSQCSTIKSSNMAAKNVKKALAEYASSPNAQGPQDKDAYDRVNDPYSDEHGKRPEPWRNGEGAHPIGPRNIAREMQSPDMIRPPSTDHGTLPNMKWSFADSHTRIEVSSIHCQCHLCGFGDRTKTLSMEPC